MMNYETKQRDFLYIEDCCKALETVMDQYFNFTSDTHLHIISCICTSILEIALQME